MLMHLVPEGGYPDRRGQSDADMEEVRRRLDMEAIRLSEKYRLQQDVYREKMASDSLMAQKELYDVEVLGMVVSYKKVHKTLRELYGSMNLSLVVTKAVYDNRGRSVT